jgi:hypothetical protein
MLQCLVNNEPRLLDSGVETWGEVLSALQPDHARRRHVVTAVRFDGVDQPSFAAAEFASTPLGNPNGAYFLGRVAAALDSVAQGVIFEAMHDRCAA